MLSLSFRERLTTFAHGEYLKGMTFYKVTNLDNRIKNVDQLITQDITKFSESLAHLYSDITKPIVDIGLFALKLGQSIGPNAPLLMLSYFFTSGYILKTISPPFGRFIAKEQSLEGEFRHAHSRIIAHSEEIAFYHGNLKEEKIINSAFGKIVQHCSMVHFLKFGNGIIDSVLVKYLATQLAYFILSRPVFSNSDSTRLSVEDLQEDPTKIMEDYSRNSGYLINLSQAVGRLVLAGRDLTKFAGYTWRVSELFKVLDDLSESGRYERSMRNKMGIDEHRIITEGELEGNVVTESDKDTTTGSTSTSSATTTLSPFIEFKNVPITTPNGDILVDNMNFRVEKGMNCMISGPNGCGKSSLFRILGQLWPIFSGTLTKPKEDEIFYVPQRPYLPIGSLRDQIIYPGLESKISDGELKELLKVVQLDYLVDREEGGLDAIRDWQDVLSGGEKQRLALTRLFYHRPAFAILDESTSAVSLDVEAIIYKYAQEVLEITLFTVSHRQSLIPFHEYLLKFDGEGGYEFKRMSTPISIDFNSNEKEKEKEKEKSSENMNNIWMKNASIETSNSNMVNTQNNNTNTDTNILNNSTASTSLPLSDYLMSTPQLLYSYPKQQHQPDHESDSSKKNSNKK